MPRFPMMLAACAVCLGFAHSARAQFAQLQSFLVPREVRPDGTVVDLPTSGGVVAAATGQLLRIELRYRIFDLVNDNVGSRGLSSAAFRIRASPGATGTVSRSALTVYQANPLSAGPAYLPALNPDASGTAAGVTGLIEPFRGGLVIDTAPSNGTPTLDPAGWTFVPLTLAAPGQISWLGAVDPTAGNTNANTAQWGVYSFDYVVGATDVIFIVDAEPDVLIGNRFGYFTRTGSTNNTVPVTSTLSLAGTLNVLVGAGPCCFPDNTCTVLPVQDCLLQGGIRCLPPSVLSPPANQNVAAGGIAIFSAVIGGSGPFQFRWLFNGTPLQDNGRILGSETMTLRISNVQGSDAGTYSLRAVAPCSISVTTPPAILTTCTAISGSVIVTPSVPLESQTMALTITPPVTGNAIFQWRRGGINLVNTGRISGVNSPVLIINPAQLNDSASYDCMVSTDCGSATIGPSIITVLPCLPTITTQPSQTSPLITRSATFTVGTTQSGAGFAWRRNGVVLNDGGRFAGARTQQLTINNVLLTDAGAYDVVVSSPCGSLVSTPVGLIPRTCTADVNASGTITPQDVFDFVAAYFAVCP